MQLESYCYATNSFKYKYSPCQHQKYLFRLLLKAIDPDSGIRKHDVDNVFEYIIEASTVGVQAAMNFIGNHYEELKE